MDRKFINLLASSIKEKPDSDVVRELFGRYSSIQELLSVSEQELTTIRGIGKARAQQLMVALSLAMYNPVANQDRVTISSPHDVYALTTEFQYMEKEHFLIVLLNTKNAVMGVEQISIGSLNTSLVHPREVYRPAIRNACASIILVHNHPSGDPTASRQDMDVTKRLVDAGRLLGVEVLDHIILGHGRFTSMREKGLL